MVSAGLPNNPETLASSMACATGALAGTDRRDQRDDLQQFAGLDHRGTRVDLEKDIDSAAREVQAAINGAMSLLLAATNNRYRKANPSDMPIMDYHPDSELKSTARSRPRLDRAGAEAVTQVQG